jgi:hypothetical protein
MFKLWLEHQQMQRRKSIETGERLRQTQTARNTTHQPTIQLPNMHDINSRIYARRMSEPVYQVQNMPWTGKETFLVREESMEDLLFEGLRTAEQSQNMKTYPLRVDDMEEYDANQGMEDVLESPR